MSAMYETRKLPIGVDLFENIVENDYYYVDKTLLIKKILNDAGAVNLFTRPRRFGKTLNMSMLKCFFEKVILLIDEYDVPLDKANDSGYYPEMVNFLRGFFGGAFKTNPDLCFAVVTDCLRISGQSARPPCGRLRRIPVRMPCMTKESRRSGRMGSHFTKRDAVSVPNG